MVTHSYVFYPLAIYSNNLQEHIQTLGKTQNKSININHVNNNYMEITVICSYCHTKICRHCSACLLLMENKYLHDHVLQCFICVPDLRWEWVGRLNVCYSRFYLQFRYLREQSQPLMSCLALTAGMLVDLWFCGPVWPILLWL